MGLPALDRVDGLLDTVDALLVGLLGDQRLDDPLLQVGDLLRLGVTIVRTDPYRIGQVAAQLAFSRIAGDERPPQRVLLPVDLIVRGSGEISI
ncbi:MAG TPA: substrate-binding domain-containing protein [Solirubrobacteraceae bacterium]|nr:substrate-binding domain-containing protein [Solirubrobacteraceae bacterium]